MSSSEISTGELAEGSHATSSKAPFLKNSSETHSHTAGSSKTADSSNKDSKKNTMDIHAPNPRRGRGRGVLRGRRRGSQGKRGSATGGEVESFTPQSLAVNRRTHPHLFFSRQPQERSQALSGKERAKTEKNLNLLLRGLIGHLTVVELRNESMAAGKIVNVDGFMNISMAETTFRKVNGQETEFEQFFIVGRNVRFVHIPDHLDIMAVIQRELSKITKSRTGDVIGRGRGRGRGRNRSMNPNFVPIGSTPGKASKLFSVTKDPATQNKTEQGK